jgi:hypothetical protein
VIPTLSLVPKKPPETAAEKLDRLIESVLDDALAADVPLDARLETLKVLKSFKIEPPEDPEKKDGLFGAARRAITEASSGDE